jgi:PEGA domain
MSEAIDTGGPLRIEVSNSQIDGGQAVSWVDPERVLGCVAFCEPPNAFERFVLPHLESTDVASDDIGNLPPVVSRLIANLKSVHLRLYRENHTLMKDPKWVGLTAAYADESRIYFIKSQTAWIYLVRDGKAFLVGDGDSPPSALDIRSGALGGIEKLQIQVTSMEIREDDLVLLVMGDASQPPDQRAVSNLFRESHDLKRACDGLVNLLGLQAGSAAVVAFRFVTLLSGIENKNMTCSDGENYLGEMNEWAKELIPTETDLVQVVEPTVVSDDINPPPQIVSPLETEPAEVSEPSLPEKAESDSEESELGDPDELVAYMEKRGGVNTTLVWVFVAVALLAAATFVLSGAGWPGLFDKVKSLFTATTEQTSAATDYFLLDVTSEPAGAIVAIDGEKIPGRTPLSNLKIPGGPHHVAMHLGVAGAWADSIDIAAGERKSIHAAFIGSLSISAQDDSNNPRVWLAGQTGKLSLPAQFDSLPTGWYRVFFEDDNIPLWERKVLVRNGICSNVEINNAFSSEKVLLHVEGMTMSDQGRLRPSFGDSVYLNHDFVGLTPIELEIEPGLHGVQVRHGEDTYQEVLRLPAGASRFVTPQFGLRSFPRFVHRAPDQVVLQGPVFLATEIDSEANGMHNPMLHLPDTPHGPQAIPMRQIDTGVFLFVGQVDSTLFRIGEETPYYFSITTLEGQEAVSDLFSCHPVASASELVDTVSN